MDTRPTLILVFRVFGETSFEEHVNPIYLGARIEEGEIEKVAVKAGHDGWLDLSDVFKEARDGGRL